MRKIKLLGVFCLLIVTACKSQSPLEAKFKKAIDVKLASQPLCIGLLAPLPDDMADSRLQDKTNAAAQLYVGLEKAGLLKSSSVTVNGGIWGPSGPGRRFELTEAGQKAATPVPPAPFSNPNKPQIQFCYATKAVHKVLNWSEPPGSLSQVSFNYELVGLASWAKLPEIQNASYGAIQQAIDLSYQGSKPRTEVWMLELTHNGWQVR